MKRTLIVVMAAGAVLSGCSLQPVKPSTEPTAAEKVNQEMLETSTSVDNSLKVLTQLERGDAGPRKPDPIGQTVAGAAGPDRSPIEMAKYNAQASEAALAKHLKITWHGNASPLLQQIADAVGFSFEVVGDGKSLPVVLNVHDESVKTVLADVADQVDGRADVRVSLPSRRIQLIYK